MNQILDDVEDPDETFQYALQSAMENLNGIRTLTVDVTATKRSLQIKASKMLRTTPGLYTEALDAIAAGDEDAARHALLRQQATFLIVEDLHDKITDLENHEQILIAEIPAIEGPLASMRDQIEELSENTSLLSLEEKDRIRSITETTIQIQQQTAHFLKGTKSAFSELHLPNLPENVTNTDAIGLIEIYAPLSVIRGIEVQLGNMQEVYPAQEASPPTEDNFHEAP